MGWKEFLRPNKIKIIYLIIIILIILSSIFYYQIKQRKIEKNPQIECLGSCRCMEKCNESGPEYIISSKEGLEECSINLINKKCCCSGV